MGNKSERYAIIAEIAGIYAQMSDAKRGEFRMALSAQIKDQAGQQLTDEEREIMVRMQSMAA